LGWVFWWWWWVGFFPLEDDARKIQGYVSRLLILITSIPLNELEGGLLGRGLPRSAVNSVALGRTTAGNADAVFLQFEGHFHAAWRFSKCIHV